MSHLYPIAASSDDALRPDSPAALTRAQAEQLAGKRAVLSLETEWRTVTVEEAEQMLAAAEAGQGHEFIQQYENADGKPVLAITYWRISETAMTPPESTLKAKQEKAAEEDHTDDLYFRSGRTKPRGRRKAVDPRQMELFQSSDPKS